MMIAFGILWFVQHLLLMYATVADDHHHDRSSFKGFARFRNGVSALRGTYRTVQTCDIGLALFVPKRFNVTGNYSVEYWRELLDEIPAEIEHVTVLSTMDKPVGMNQVSYWLVREEEQPEFNDLLFRPMVQNFNDSMERVKWRSSLTLDFARLVRFVGDHCRFVLWLEDDAILPPDWLPRVRTAIDENVNSFAYALLAESGTVGVLIDSRHSFDMTQYLTQHFDDMPVDWNLPEWLSIYAYEVRDTFLMYPPPRVPIFGHRGAVSSFKFSKARETFAPKDVNDKEEDELDNYGLMDDYPQENDESDSNVDDSVPWDAVEFAKIDRKRKRNLQKDNRRRSMNSLIDGESLYGEMSFAEKMTFGDEEDEKDLVDDVQSSEEKGPKSSHVGEKMTFDDEEDEKVLVDNVQSGKAKPRHDQSGGEEGAQQLAKDDMAQGDENVLADQSDQSDGHQIVDIDDASVDADMII
jgi:hypothetical protein